MFKWRQDNMWLEWALLALYSFEIAVWVAGFGFMTPSKKKRAKSDFFGWQPDSSKSMGFLDDKWRVLGACRLVVSS